MRIGEWLNQFFHEVSAVEQRHRASETPKEASQLDTPEQSKKPPYPSRPDPAPTIHKTKRRPK